MDTGVGRVSYSFMMQGQIDQILSSNPIERRAIFEEAAGISRYKAQRREALNKLALVDTNLARVTDVIDEVARQIGTLKRQAGKALRYKRIRLRLTHLDLALSAYKYSELHESIKTVEGESAQFRQTEEQLSEGIGALERDLNDKRERRAQLYEQLQEAQQRVFDLRAEKDQAESQAEFSSVRATDIKDRIEKMAAGFADLAEQRKALAEKSAGDLEARQEQQNLFKDSDKAFKDRGLAVTAIQERLSEAESAMQQSKQDLLMAESSITRLRSKCTTLQVDLKTYQVKHAGLSDEIFTRKEESEALENQLKEYAKARQSRILKKQREDSDLEKLRQSQNQLGDDLRAVQTGIQETDRAHAQKIAQLGVLEELQEKFEGFSEGAKAILQGELDSILNSDVHHLLTQQIQVDDEFTPALEALLGPAIDAIVLKETNKVVSVTSELENRKLGRACLQIPGQPIQCAAAGNLPEFLQPASELFKGRNAAMESLLSNLINGCYVCDDLGAFLKFWKANPDFSFLLVGTRKGELVDCRGLVYGGHSKGQSETFLQREAHIKSLKKACVKDEKQLETLRAKSQKMQLKLEESEQKVEDKRQSLVEVGNELSTLQAQEQTASVSIKQKQERSQIAGRDLAVLEKDREDSEKRLTAAQNELAAAETHLGKLRASIEELEGSVTGLRQDHDAHREGLSEVRLELAVKRQRLELINRGLSEIDKQVEALNQMEAQQRLEIDTLTEQTSELESGGQQAVDKAEQISKTLTITEESLDTHRKTHHEAESAIKEIEVKASAIRDELSGAQGELNRRNVDLAREQSQLDYLIQDIRREYDDEISEIDWKMELWKAGDALPERMRVDIDVDKANDEDAAVDERGDPTEQELQALEHTDWDALAGEVDALRSRLSAMGPVNLVAIEEYAELKERHEFLKDQSEDLWKSKDQLLAAIEEINKTSTQLFQDTFDQVARNFTYTFETLFGGGHSELRLVDGEDVLESGIDIIARPPGTKLRSLQLLSGGQKTMTAVALLFAIYMVKPSPFCLLDELDAPLDDANIGRFTDMVKQFTRYSQFIIITHNRGTVQAAQTIYGISMGTDSASQAFSIDVNDYLKQPELI